METGLFLTPEEWAWAEVMMEVPPKDLEKRLTSELVKKVKESRKSWAAESRVALAGTAFIGVCMLMIVFIQKEIGVWVAGIPNVLIFLFFIFSTTYLILIWRLKMVAKLRRWSKRAKEIGGGR